MVGITDNPLLALAVSSLYTQLIGRYPDLARNHDEREFYNSVVLKGGEGTDVRAYRVQGGPDDGKLGLEQRIGMGWVKVPCITPVDYDANLAKNGAVTGK